MAAARHCNTAARFLNHGTSDLKRSPSPAVEESQTGREEGRARIGRGQIQTEERETGAQSDRSRQTAPKLDRARVRERIGVRRDQSQTEIESDRAHVRSRVIPGESRVGPETDRARLRQGQNQTGPE